MLQAHGVVELNGEPAGSSEGRWWEGPAKEWDNAVKELLPIIFGKVIAGEDVSSAAGSSCSSKLRTCKRLNDNPSEVHVLCSSSVQVYLCHLRNVAADALSRYRILTFCRSYRRQRSN